MKRTIIFCTLFVCFSMYVGTVAEAAVNILDNPGYEESGWPPLYWSEWEGSASGLPVDGVAGYLNTSSAHSGAQCVVKELYGSGIRWGGYSQDAGVTAGQNVTAKGWLMSPLGPSLKQGAQAYIELKFIDANSNELGAYQSLPLTRASDWVEHSITQTAPSGTATARFSFVLFGDGRKPSGMAYFDDAALEVDGADTTPPVVAIISPLDGTITNSYPVEVTGTVDDPLVTSIDVNGVIAPVSGGSWSGYVSLTEGSNAITAAAQDPSGNTGLDSIIVYLDTVAPVVAITSPQDQTTTGISPIAVSGTVDDPSITSIDVNGTIEPVSGGSWSSTVSLGEGANLITATVVDGAGNGALDSITVYLVLPNLLLNPGFEDSAWPPVNWSEWQGAASGNPADGVYGYIETASVRSGSQSVVRGLYGTGIRWGGYSQEIAVGGWDLVRASCWLMSPSTGGSLANGATAQKEIKFSDAGNEELGLCKSALLTAASPWVQHVIEKGAPGNAVRATVSLVLVGNLDTSTGDVYFDDARVEVVPGGAEPDPGIPFDKPQSTGPVRISGRALSVGGSQFTIKGVCYQPVPIGEVPWEYDVYSDAGTYNRDLPILRDMGVNAIRTYAKVTSVEFLDACYNGGIDPIYVVMGYFIDGSSNLGDPAVKNSIKSDFQAYVNTYKNHPAVLMWSPGNETEWAYKGCDYEYYTLINELAEAAYIEEGSAYHPVTAVLMDIYDIGDGNLLATDEYMDYLDVWGANVYRGITFGTVFDDYAAMSGKPFWIPEFGVDAWRTDDKYGDPAAGYVDEASQEQYAVALWDEIAARSDVCSGGMLFEYSDEWWKSDYGDPVLHEYGGFVYANVMTHPDGYSNEEWYGVVAVSDNGTGPDTVTPRSVYYGLQSRWVEEDTESKMHVRGVSMSLVYSGPLVRAQAVVTVYDENDQPVNGAVVYGSWSGLTGDTDSGIANVEGVVALSSDKIRSPQSGSQFTFTVTNIELADRVYDPASDVEISDSISIP